MASLSSPGAGKAFHAQSTAGTLYGLEGIREDNNPWDWCKQTIIHHRSVNHHIAPPHLPGNSQVKQLQSDTLHSQSVDTPTVKTLSTGEPNAQEMTDPHTDKFLLD